MLKPIECEGCPLQHVGNSFSIPDGKGTSNIAIVGEALGYEEAIEGKPFRPKASAGSKLEEIFREATKQTLRPISRDQFLLWNVIACQPPGNELRGADYEYKAIEHCKRHFNRVLPPIRSAGDSASNRIIFALGNTPLTALTGMTGVFEEKQSISHLRGFVFNTRYGLVVPSYHPAFLRRGNNHLTPVVVQDLIKVLEVAGGRFIHHPFRNDYAKPVYQTRASLDEAKAFYYKVKDGPKYLVTYDIETPETANIDEDERDELANAEIKLVQFSLSKGTGIAMPYEGQYIPIIHAIFALDNVKANHNTWNFDNPRLRAKGVDINGIVHDTMWMYKHWQPNLPRGLQHISSTFGFPFPWKHMYLSNLEFYGCADVDAVQWIIRALPPMMKERGVWDGYMRHVVRMYTVLSKASDLGIPVLEEKRLETKEIFEKKRNTFDGELQEIIPDTVKNIRPRRKRKLDDGSGRTEIDYGYIREPREVKNGRIRYAELVEILKSKGQTPTVSFDDWVYRKFSLVYANFKDDDGSIIQRWCKIAPFKASSTQLIKYLNYKQTEVQGQIDELIEYRQTMYGGKDKETTEQINELKHLKDCYDVPLTLKTRKPTTSKKELEEIYLKTSDPVLEKVMKIRSLDTNLNNYIPNWKPSRDGAVHTQWGFTAPTGQKDSRKPNILNCSKHTEFGNEFRGIVVARKGRKFVEFDKKSFHVATMGFCANDPEYIRFSQLDPHSIFTSHINPELIGQSISFKWSDKDIMEACREIKKLSKALGKQEHGIDIRQAMAKPTVLGNQLGLGARKLQWQNRRFIRTLSKAEELQAVLGGLFPKVARFKDAIREEAHLKKWLMTMFGFIQYFYDVYTFSWNKRRLEWDRRPGDDSEKCIAFPVQGNAFGMIDTEILEMDRLGICDEHWFINTIHDSVIFEPEEGKVDRCIEEVTRIMNAPCKYLINEATGPQGLIVKVDAAVGRNWKAYDKETNPDGLVEIHY